MLVEVPGHRQTSSSNRPAAPLDAELVARIRRILATAPADKPLPSTRDLGKRFDVANATAFRVLQKLAEDGELWHHPTSGRYYPSTARELLEQPKPTACLIRRLELDSEQYRELLEGVSLGCGALHRTMMLWHDVHLVNHPDPRNPPLFAPIPQQKEILRHFLQRHGKAAGGFLLDHLWADEALRVHEARLKPTVVLYRTCSVKTFSNVCSDFRSGASKALTHLLGRGFEQITPVIPFAGDPSIEEFFTALARVAEEAGCKDRLTPAVSASTAAERQLLTEMLRKVTRRTALVCPEDNVASFLIDGIRAAGISVPHQVGLLTAMGTDFAIDAKISCLRYDFREMGKLAVEAIGSQRPVFHALEPHLVLGSTT